MRYDWYVKVLVLSSIGFIGINHLNAESTRSVVIVAGSSSPLVGFSRKEVRRLYLGIPVYKDGLRIRPLLNYTDTEIEKIFLQKIIYMSRRNYERSILSNVYRRGEQRPEKYTDISLLIDELKRSPDTLSYIWQDQLDEHEDIKTIGILWTGHIE